MTSIVIAEGNQSIRMLYRVLFTKDKSILIYCPVSKCGVYKLSSDARKISDNAFRGCSNLASISIPCGTETIGLRAFQEAPA